MALYIDLDIAIKAAAKAVRDQFTAVDVVTALEEAPTADVAPRAEVAREIFEGIEKYMMDSVDVTHTAYKTIGTSTFAILKKKYTEEQK